MKELADHVDHVSRKDQQEQAQAYCSEVLPQTPIRGTDTDYNKNSMAMNSIPKEGSIGITPSSGSQTFLFAIFYALNPLKIYFK